MKHTEGKWIVDGGQDQHGRGGERVFKVVKNGLGGGLIADVSAWWVDTKTAEANASLIAAAPDLLAALEAALDCIEGFGSEDEALLSHINNAIAKAKGGK